MIEYFPKAQPDGTVTVAKVDDGDVETIYKVTGHQCECPGNIYHKTLCKHVKIVKRWQEIGCPPGGWIIVNSRPCFVGLTEEAE